MKRNKILSVAFLITGAVFFVLSIILYAFGLSSQHYFEGIFADLVAIFFLVLFIKKYLKERNGKL